MSSTLYERLGGADKVAQIASDIVEAHLVNPTIKSRFEVVEDVDQLKEHVRTFFSSGTGGPDAYEGRDMLSAHKGMNVSEEELVAAIDDVLAVLNKHQTGQQEKDEVLAILYSMKDEIVRQ